MAKEKRKKKGKRETPKSKRRPAKKAVRRERTTKVTKAIKSRPKIGLETKIESIMNRSSKTIWKNDTTLFIVVVVLASIIILSTIVSLFPGISNVIPIGAFYADNYADNLSGEETSQNQTESEDNNVIMYVVYNKG